MLRGRNIKAAVVGLLGILALVVTAVPVTAHEGRHPTDTPAVSFYSVDIADERFPARLYSVALDGGGHVNTREIGEVGFEVIEGLAFDADGTLFGVDASWNDTLAGTLSLVTIDTATGAGTRVGPLGVLVNDPSLTFDCAGNLWMTGYDAAEENPTFYRVDPDTGAATEVGALGPSVFGLATRGTTVFGLGKRSNLVTIDTSTGVATNVGPLANARLGQGAGLAFAADGTLWGINDGETSYNGSPTEPDLFTINTSTGSATVWATMEDEPAGRVEFDSMAIHGGPVCGQDVPAPVGGNATQGTGGDRDPSASEPGEPTPTRAGGEDAGSPSRSEAWTVADRAPSGKGVTSTGDPGAAGAAGGAGDADVLAAEAAGRSSSDGGTGPLVAVLLSVFGVLGLAGWRR